MTDFESLQEVVNYTVDTFGRIDVLFNNAGIMPLSLLSEGHRDEWQQMLNVNIMGVLNGI